MADKPLNPLFIGLVRDMDSVEADIREALPKLKAEKIQPLVELLQELAESPVDLVELEEADLAEILKPLQARPLIRYFKDKYKDDDSGGKIKGLKYGPQALRPVPTRPISRRPTPIVGRFYCRVGRFYHRFCNSRPTGPIKHV